MHSKLLWFGALIVWIGCTSDSNEFEYKISHDDQCNKIQLVYQNDTVMLSKSGRHWNYNQQFKVRQNAIDNLLDAAYRIELDYIPTQSAQKVMLSNLKSDAIHATFYNGNQVLQSYYVGGSTPDERGTFVTKSLDQRPIVARINGWTGNVRTRFWMNEIDWRDRAAIALQPKDIISVKIDYPKQQDASFYLSKAGNTFKLASVYPTQKLKSPNLFIPQAAEVYIESFENLQSEYIIEDLMQMPNFTGRVPFCKLEVVTTANDSIAFDFFPQIEIRETEVPFSQAIGRYYMINESKEEAFTVQHRLFKNVFRPYSFFFRAESRQD